jgi:hypothetical protein
VLPSKEAAPAGSGRIIEMPGGREAYAAHLYAAMHAADKEGWDWIAVIQPPDGPEWAGILDRLRRATR